VAGLQIWIAALCAALSSAPLPAPVDRAQGRYYTPDQARLGAQLFAAHCAACHDAQLQGIRGKGPILIGPTIRARRWPLSGLLSFISHEMPANARGSLTPPEYLSLMAFLLQKNGHPAGSKTISPTLLQNASKRF
jgi:mono/diheme cytochrome c family protein